MKTQSRAYIYAILSVLLWSTVGTAFKITLSEVSVIQLLLFAAFVSSFVLLLIIIVSGRIKNLKNVPGKSIFVYSLTGFLNPFLYYLVLFEAYRLLPAQEALSLNYTWAIMIVIFSIIFLHQKIKFFSIISIIISFLGVIIIATHGDLTSFHFNNINGTLLAIGSSFIWATYWIMNMKDEGSDELIKLFISFSFGFVYILIFALFTNEAIFNISAKGIFGSVYIGMFEISITFYFWLMALKLSENTAKVSSLILLSPFISLNLMSVILGETILISTIFGLLLIITGIIISKLR